MDFDSYNVGDPIPEKKHPVGKYQPIYYAGASGDFNLIHIDPEFGKMVGLGGNVLQGLCTMAFAAITVTDFAGDPGALKKLKVRFAKPVRPLDNVIVQGKVAAKDADTLTLEMNATTKKGEVEVLSQTVAVVAKV